jgi:hypothetical protein
MRVIYLTLAAFVALGIGAACRSPGLAPADCTPGQPNTAACIETRR